MQRKYKLIRISAENAKVLDNAGKLNETYDTVLTRIFEQNKLLGVVTEEED